MFKAITKLLIADGSIIINRALAKEIGLHEAIVYAELLSKCNWYKANNKLNKGWFFSTIEDLQDSTTLSGYQQRKAIKHLRALGLIDVKWRGMPKSRYFKIIEDSEIILKLLSSKNKSSSDEETKPPVVKKLNVSREETSRPVVKKLDDYSEETKRLVVKKLHINNNNRIITSNKNKNNNNNSGQAAEVEEVIKYWNGIDGIRKIRTINLNTNRYRSLKARLDEYSLEEFKEAIENINKSSFLKGQNSRGWLITFDWLIKPNNFIKVLEGNYNDSKGEADNERDDERDTGKSRFGW